MIYNLLFPRKNGKLTFCENNELIIIDIIYGKINIYSIPEDFPPSMMATPPVLGRISEGCVLITQSPLRSLCFVPPKNPAGMDTQFLPLFDVIMSLAICRMAKLKKSNLAGSGSHVSRSRPTQNANPSVTPNNRSLIATDDRSPLQDLVTAKIAETHQGAVRSNAVHAVEFLLSASPDFFRPTNSKQYGAYDPVCLAAWAECNIKWLADQYGDRIVRAELHLDEATPHIHAYLVPIDRRGQLNCRGIFGERKNMFALQDSYAEAMEPLGIERGIRGSKARHTDIDKYYTDVNEFVGGGMELIAHLKSENAELTAKLQDSIEEADRLRTERDDLRKQLEVTLTENEEIARVTAKPTVIYPARSIKHRTRSIGRE